MRNGVGGRGESSLVDRHPSGHRLSVGHLRRLASLRGARTKPTRQYRVLRRSESELHTFPRRDPLKC